MKDGFGRFLARKSKKDKKFFVSWKHRPYWAFLKERSSAKVGKPDQTCCAPLTSRHCGITPCKQVPRSELNFCFHNSQRGPQNLFQNLTSDSEHHISSGEGNLRKPKYIPCRILLGLSANTMFVGV